MTYINDEMKYTAFCVTTLFLLTFFVSCTKKKSPQVPVSPQDSLADHTVQLDFMGIRIGQPFHQRAWVRQYGVKASIISSPTQNDSTLIASFYEPHRNLRVNINMLRDSSVYKVEVYLYNALNDSLWKAVHAQYGNDTYQNKLYPNILVLKHIWNFKNQRLTAYENTETGWEMMKFTYEDKALAERAEKGSKATTSTTVGR